MTLDNIIDDLLSIKKEEAVRQKPIIEKARDFLRRKDILKEMQDEQIAEEAKVVKMGDQASAFIVSPYYRDIIEPHIRSSVKSSLQRIIRDGENLTEAQLKCEIAGIKKALGIIAVIKLRIAQGQQVKEKHAV